MPSRVRVRRERCEPLMMVGCIRTPLLDGCRLIELTRSAHLPHLYIQLAGMRPAPWRVDPPARDRNNQTKQKKNKQYKVRLDRSRAAAAVAASAASWCSGARSATPSFGPTRTSARSSRHSFFPPSTRALSAVGVLAQILPVLLQGQLQLIRMHF